MKRRTKTASRSGGFHPVAAGRGRAWMPRGAVLSMGLSLLIALVGCGGAWGVDVAHQTDAVPNSATDSTEVGASGYVNPSNVGTNNGSPGSIVREGGYTIYNGRLYRAVARQTTQNNAPNYTWNAPTYAWELVQWAEGGNHVNIISNTGNATGSGNGITGSGNVVNISGSGAVGRDFGTLTGGTLTMYHSYTDTSDPLNPVNYTGYENGNTLRIGVYDANGAFLPPASGSLNNDFLAGGSVDGTVDLGYGTVIMYDGTVSGTITANTSTALVQAATGNDASDYAYTNFTQYGGTVTGTVNMAGEGSVNHYFVTKHDVISAATIKGSVEGGAINMNGDGTTNRFSQNAGFVGKDSADAQTNIYMNGENSLLNIYQQVNSLDNSNLVGPNNDPTLVVSENDANVFIGNADSDTTDYHAGIFYVGGGTRSGAATIVGDNNLFWLNSAANYNGTAATTISSGDNHSGNNVAVVDLASPHGSGGFDMAGTLDMSGTIKGANNIFLANGDITGTITTSGIDAGGAANDSSTHVFVGYTNDQAGNVYSWRSAIADGMYDLTGLNAVPSGAPGITTQGDSYFSLSGQVNDTSHLNVAKIQGGGGELHVHVSAGDAYNIKGHKDIDNITVTHKPGDTSSGSPATYDSEYVYMYPYQYSNAPDTNSIWHTNTIGGIVPYAVKNLLFDISDPSTYTYTPKYNFEDTTDYFNHGGYITYSVLNQDVINVGAYVDVYLGAATDNFKPGDPILSLSPTTVTIGAIKDMTGTAPSVAAGDFNNTYKPIDVSSGEWIPGEHDNHTIDYYLRDANGDGIYDNYQGRADAHTYGKWSESYTINEGTPEEAEVVYQAQITAGMVNVFAGSKLTIHPNVGEMGTKDDAFKTANTNSYNVIDNLNIIGMPDDPANCNDCGYTPYNPSKWAIVTLDRTTVYTTTEGTKITHGVVGDGTIYYPGENDAGYYYANVVVGTNGILQGFGEITADDDHSPLRPNLVGDVAVLAGGMLRPYDAHYEGKQIFNYEDKTWETIGDGGIFVVHGNALDEYALTHADYVENSGGNFDRNADRLKGVIMKIDGTVYMEHASRVSTNLFADLDVNSDPLSIVSDGTDVRNNPVVVGRVPAGQALDVTRHKGDGIEATEKFVFDEIKYTSAYLRNGVYDLSIPGTSYYSLTDPKIWTGVAQHNKVQYVPSFGFVNELKTKLDYNIYWGDPVVQDGDATYYYQVTYNSSGSTEKIDALVGMPDANHLFNRDIVFSDMLGNWSFEKQADDAGVVLRYRQVAKHAQDGGIAIDQNIRNSKEVGYKLDEIRYPFLTAYNMDDPGLQGLFEKDPSLDGSGVVTPYDTVNAADHEYAHYDGNPYDAEGFNGDIKEYYYLNQDRFTNYRDYWVEDIENYFRALQLNVTAQADIYLSLRLLSAEPYASQINSDLSAMNRFIDSRERNGMSALWLVEEKQRMANEEMGVGRNGFDEDMPTEFVQNPLRVWATALGSNYRQKDVGDEYGYKNSGYGLQLGFIKEIGDAYFGLTGAYTNTKNKWSDLQADNKSDNYMAEALVGLRRGRFFLELSANAGYMDHSMTRDLTHGASLSGGPYDPQLDCNIDDNYYNGVYSVKHYADFHNRVLGGGLRLGYQKVLGEKWLFLPTVGLRFQDVRNPKSLTEKGKETAAFRLVFDKGDMKRQSLQIPVMFRLSRGIAFNDGGPTILTPEVRVGVTYEAMDRGGTADYQWIGNPIPNRTMKAWGIREDRLGLQAGVTLELSRRGRFYAAMNYDTIYRDKGFTHNYSFQAGVNF